MDFNFIKYIMNKSIWYLLFCLLTVSFAKAQVDLKNTGILYLGSSADTIYINGNLINSSTAALSNNGILQVKQNLVNDQASMPAGTGTLYLNGITTQTISGTQVFKTFNLTTDNAAGILLNNNLSASGVHTFTAGMITTSATPNYMIYEAGSSYTGSSDSRHVFGWVKKSGSTDFAFPVGTASYLRPVSLTNLTAAGEFDVLHHFIVTPDRYSLYNPLVYVDSAEHWTINKVSGAAARVAMNWDNSKIPFPNLMVMDIRAAWYDGIFWRNIGGSATGDALTTGNVTSNSISVFNAPFTIGSVSFVLPLKIISFTAGQLNGHTKLNWTIGNELNVDLYELERSDDGIHFYTIYAHNPYNRNGTEFYSYNDMNIIKGTTYYRLKVYNRGSSIHYSHIVTVSANSNTKLFYVITNPVDDMIQVYANTAVKGTYNYTITNTGGQVMQSGILDIEYTGVYAIPLRSVLATGAYILVLQNEDNRLQRMVIKN